MDKYIEIVNDGEMDINALLLLGASTKRGDESKIGYFGSGLKYAIAVFLRNKIGFEIYSGKNKITISTRKVNFRGQTFNKIYVGGKHTSLTTEMGVDWEPWFALREVYCNALDESSPGFTIVDDIDPIEGKTKIYIKNDEKFKDILQNWDKYFSQKRKDIVFQVPGFTAYYGSSDEYILYRRGVQCHSQKRKCLFHYDLDNIEINESRTLKHSIDNIWKTAELVARHASLDMVRRIYDEYKDSIEETFMWREAGVIFNQNWLDVIGGRRLVRKYIAGYFVTEIRNGSCLVLPSPLINALCNQFKNKIVVLGESTNHGKFLVTEKEPKEIYFIDEAITFLKDSKIDIDYDIVVGIFEDTSILGQADNNRIILSKEVFEKGKKKIVEVIYEEFIHLKYNLNDETRVMQDFLIQNLISQFEKQTGVYL